MVYGAVDSNGIRVCKNLLLTFDCRNRVDAPSYRVKDFRLR